MKGPRRTKREVGIIIGSARFYTEHDALYPSTITDKQLELLCKSARFTQCGIVIDNPNHRLPCRNELLMYVSEKDEDGLQRIRKVYWLNDSP